GRLGRDANGRRCLSRAAVAHRACGRLCRVLFKPATLGSHRRDSATVWIPRLLQSVHTVPPESLVVRALLDWHRPTECLVRSRNGLADHTKNLAARRYL